MPRRGMGVEISIVLTSLQTFTVMPRRGMGVEIYYQRGTGRGRHSHAPQGHGSRNGLPADYFEEEDVMPRRGMGVEIAYRQYHLVCKTVMPRRGMGVEIGTADCIMIGGNVMPRRGMGVEIYSWPDTPRMSLVMPRRGMGVEIQIPCCRPQRGSCHAPQGHGSRNFMTM